MARWRATTLTKRWLRPEIQLVSNRELLRETVVHASNLADGQSDMALETRLKSGFRKSLKVSPWF